MAELKIMRPSAGVPWATVGDRVTVSVVKGRLAINVIKPDARLDNVLLDKDEIAALLPLLTRFSETGDLA